MTINNLPASVQAIVQDGTLVREFEDALFPNLVYRRMFEPEEIATGIGETVTKTRTALLPKVTTALAPATNSDLNSGMTPKTPLVEQYSLTLAQYGDTVDTNMLSSIISLASNYLRNAKALGLQAAQSLDGLAARPLFDAYGGGHTMATASDTTTTEVPVDDVRGFLTVVVAGKPVPVSVTNPLAITVDDVANTVTGVDYDPDDREDDGFGRIPGTLTVGTEIATLTQGDVVLASTRPTIMRVGGGSNIDAITGSNLLVLQTFINAAATLRSRGVPKWEDGTYHVGLDPLSMAQLFNDDAFQRIYEANDAKGEAYREGTVTRLAGLTFFETEEAPTHDNGTTTVRMPIVCGAGTGVEGRFAGVGQWLKEFTGGANGMILQTEDPILAMIARAPLDRLQQVVANSWSAIGDWVIPTDINSSIGGSAAAYKRSVLIMHGS